MNSDTFPSEEITYQTSILKVMIEITIHYYHYFLHLSSLTITITCSNTIKLFTQTSTTKIIFINTPISKSISPKININTTLSSPTTNSSVIPSSQLSPTLSTTTTSQLPIISTTTNNI
ncbi:hypothetical protein ACTFIZ_001946 [Dictyostelium cf. discoideum]